MKRIFPVIVVLISLSLLGLIVLQLSWFRNLHEVTRNQISNRISDAGIAVAQDLAKATRTGQVLRLSRRSPLGLGSEFQFRLYRQPTIEEKFAMEEVQGKIRKAFDRQNLDKLKFEFAVTNTNDDYEMYSAGYEKEFWDTLNNKRIYLPILPENLENETLPNLEKLIIIVPDIDQQVWQSLRWFLVGAIVFLLIILAAFYVTVRTLINQKNLSKIKSDFINNMTHEFKTPLATISLAVDALKNEKVLSNREKTNYFRDIIKEENNRMNRHVETILQAATMEKQELKLNLQPLALHDLVQQVLDAYQLQLQEKNAQVVLQLNARQDRILADEVHFGNLVSNLVDNALKYSPDGLHLTLTTHATANNIVLRVQDNGIGMSKESVKRVFEKFFRAHTGNVHNVKGFGLGLSYVKTVIDAHKGRIKCESTLGKGTSFLVEMPLHKTI
ncbi:MAG: sensor histidine kinase [Sphingobacteriia bacterium]|nr:MAG: sensor histidine kinase [Sphingobacteriia bacterium]